LAKTGFEGHIGAVERNGPAVRGLATALNRPSLRTALRTEGVEVVDAPHNFAEREGDAILHRKGAASSKGSLLAVPGSRGAATYLVEPLADKAEAALFSLAHGAGRKHDRGSMEKRVRTEAGSLEKLTRNPFGGRVICMDRKLLVEEAPEAYKDIRRVVADLEAHGLAHIVAVMRPLITFKTAGRASREPGRKRT
jgi:release factor H-coupled RctB family protein